MPSSAQRLISRRPAGVSPGPVSGEDGNLNRTPLPKRFGRLHTGPRLRRPAAYQSSSSSRSSPIASAPSMWRITPSVSSARLASRSATSRTSRASPVRTNTNAIAAIAAAAGAACVQRSSGIGSTSHWSPEPPTFSSPGLGAKPANKPAASPPSRAEATVTAPSPSSRPSTPPPSHARRSASLCPSIALTGAPGRSRSAAPSRRSGCPRSGSRGAARRA